MKDGYKVPTNFELVQKSNVIVLARVESVPADLDAAGGGEFSQMVSLTPVKVLKGAVPKEGLGVMGWQPPQNWDGVPTATTLWQSHFSAGLGACVRQFYEPGELVVAMFDDDPRSKEVTGQTLNQVFDPWARAVETVDAPDDVWVTAIERYVAIQTGDSATLRSRVESEARQLRSVATPEAQAIAADLEYHLDRGDRSGTWGAISMPTFTAAGVDGQKGAQLLCIAGSPPGLVLEASHAGETPRLVIDGIPYASKSAVPTPMEKTLLNAPAIGSNDPSKKRPGHSLFRFDDPKTFDALRSATTAVRIEVGGKPILDGRPLDALLRWTRQCEKLQALPAPTEPGRDE